MTENPWIEQVADVIAAYVSGPDLHALGIDPAMHRDDQIEAAKRIHQMYVAAYRLTGPSA